MDAGTSLESERRASSREVALVTKLVKRKRTQIVPVEASAQSAPLQQRQDIDLPNLCLEPPLASMPHVAATPIGYQ